jgi:hypothetical protein
MVDRCVASLFQSRTTGLKSDDPRRRDAASMFTIRNSHRARRRAWIATSTTTAELSISANTNGPREIRFCWRTREAEERDEERAEAERLRDEGKLIEYEPGPEFSNN